MRNRILTAIVVLLISGSADTAIFAQCDWFTLQSQVVVDGYAYHACSADFDLNGSMDVATPNLSSNNIAVFLNHADATFAAGSYYLAGIDPSMIFSADFNGDGYPDLAAANLGSTTVTVLLNLKDGTFGAPSYYDVGAAGPYAITGADFNNDGHMDIATGNVLAGSPRAVSILLNLGDGTFGAPTTYSAGQHARHVYAVDLENDGDIDLVEVGDNTNFVSVLLNHGGGSGTFAPAANYTVGAGPSYVAAADVNLDNLIDLLVTNHLSNNVSLLVNNGNGTFAAAVHFPAGPNVHSICSADFDIDGDPDFAVANHHADYLSVFENDGTGNFTEICNPIVGFGPRTIIADYFDQDAYPDLAVVHEGIPGTVTFLLSNSSASTISVYLDINPGSCPNPLNTKGHGSTDEIIVIGDGGRNLEATTDLAAKAGPPGGKQSKSVIPMAILGTADFDVHEIDWATVTLSAVSPLRWSYEDVAAPVAPDATKCECNDFGPDGFMDMILKFDKASVIAVLGEVYDGDVVSVTLTGALLDGTHFEGVDCFLIRGDEPPLAHTGTGAFQATNYPNPANPSTSFIVTTGKAAAYTLEVFNIRGQLVWSSTGTTQAGKTVVRWDGSNRQSQPVASGVYLYRVEIAQESITKRFTLLK